MSVWSEGSEFTERPMSDIYVNKWNKKWEFDRDDLILDRTKPLGEGQFGKVYKGVAKNIDYREGDTKVAVKELKSKLVVWWNYIHQISTIRSIIMIIALSDQQKLSSPLRTKVAHLLKNAWLTQNHK